MWKFFQTLIIAGVMMLNVYFKWTPNGYLAGLMGVAAALIVTLTLNKLLDLLARFRQRKHGPSQKVSTDTLPQRDRGLISKISLDRS